MSKFIPTTRKKGACEVCGDESGKCRRPREGNIHLCMTFADARKGQIENGYKCIKRDNRGKGWATFKLDDTQEWTEEQRREWKARAEARRQVAALEAQARAARSIAAVERDRLYRQLLTELTLHPEDRADLVRRGFTQTEIDLCGFKSIDRYQRLQQQYPTLLPGIGRDGRSILMGGAGYVCPIRNHNGLIVALQVRLRQLGVDDKNRYRWLSSDDRGQVLQVKLGELPLAVCRPPGEPVGIALAEGTGAKPNWVALRLGFLTIGAAGGQWTSSPETLREILAQSADPHQPIHLFPDAGDILNRAVMHRWRQVVNLLEEWGYRVQFGWWRQTSKQHTDIDELLPGEHRLIRWLTPQEFWQIEAQQNSKGWQSWRQCRFFTADCTLNQRYFAAPLPQLREMMFVRSGLGTGKTHWLIETLIAGYADCGFLSIGYRNSLLLQFCEDDRLKERGINWYHLQSDLKDDPNGKLILRDPHSKIACCIDSLLYFAPEDFDGRIVILDEVESVVRQLLQADTAVSFQRERIKDLFFEMLRRAAVVVCLDGLLSDITVNYLHRAAPDKIVTRWLNQYQGNRGRIEFLEGTQKADKLLVADHSPILEAIYNHSGQFTVVSDSQQQCETIAQQLVEQGLNVLRVDSTTVRLPAVQRFLANPARFLVQEKIDALIYSPSAEAGLNIDIQGWFSDIYALFLGVVSTNAQLQMLARVRDPEATIHLYCALRGLGSDSVSKATVPEDLLQEVLEYVQDCAHASLHELDSAARIQQFAQQLIALSSSGHLTQEMYLAALNNHERANLRDCLREALLESGYQMEGVVTIAADKTRHQTKGEEIKRQKSDQIFAAPDLTTEEANQKARQFAATLEDKAAVQRRRLLDRLPGIEQATYPNRPLPAVLLPIRSEPPGVPLPELVPQLTEEGQTRTETAAPAPSEATNPVSLPAPTAPIFDAELVHRLKFKNPAAISEAETLWLLLHPEAAKLLQQQRWFKSLRLFTDPETPDNNKRMNLSRYRSRWLQISTLRESGLLSFLRLEREWCNQDAELLKFFAFCRQRKVQRDMKLKVGKSTPCEFLGRVLQALGLSTIDRYDHKAKVRYYRLNPERLACPVRQAIVAAVERRFEARLAEIGMLDWQSILESVSEPETLTVGELEERSPSAIFSINIQEGDQDTTLVQPAAAPPLLPEVPAPGLRDDMAKIPVEVVLPVAEELSEQELAEFAVTIEGEAVLGVQAVQSLWQDWGEGLKRVVLNAIQRQIPDLYHRLSTMLWHSPDGYLFL
ncbi:hypothetical protein NDI45_20475 [Leptolyngbya sp. GB1-A1]|uniref:plasmid replication protein, CyRepA1 family n=1 Tax=Leptolyngbya sp. GB1-A1 TaxID=2933908 RepID=UPI00329972EC